jgi:hypothetical protein
MLVKIQYENIIYLGSFVFIFLCMKFCGWTFYIPDLASLDLLYPRHFVAEPNNSACFVGVPFKVLSK